MRVTKAMLQAENEKLRLDIRTLVLEPDSMEAIEIKIRVDLDHAVENLIWAGLCPSGFEYNGFMNVIQ